jgi:hypothetical protein
MANVNDLLPTKHLRAYDLKGSEPTVTIARIVRVPLGRTREEKWVLYFVGKEKYLILNATMLRALAAFAGDETDRWPGVTLQLFTTTTKDPQGHVVPVVRLRPAATRSAGLRQRLDEVAS